MRSAEANLAEPYEIFNQALTMPFISALPWSELHLAKKSARFIRVSYP
jgi:hypothetical protein